MTDSPSTARILFLTHNYPRHREDFAGRFVARLAELVVARGHQVMVVAPHAAGCAMEEEDHGVLVRRFRYASDADEVIAYRGEMGKIQLAGPLGMAAYWRFVRSFTQAAQRAIADSQPTAMHAHWWVPGGWVASRVKSSVPLVVTMHGTDLRMIERKAWIRPLAANVFDRARTITVVSQSLADGVATLMPRARQKLRVTPMPANDTAFQPATEPSSANSTPVILCVTRFTAQKRNDVLLRAIGQLAQDPMDLRVRLVGEGPLEDEVRSLARERGIAQMIEFVPPMAQDALADEYRRADLVVLPAVDEGFGMVLIEAQMCGTAVLGARSGGIIDIIDHERTGLLFEPDDVNALTEGLKRLVRDPDLRQRVAKAGRESAERRFSSRAIVDRFLGWYGAADDRTTRKGQDTP